MAGVTAQWGDHCFACGIAATLLLFWLVLLRSKSSGLARAGIPIAIGCLGFAYAAGQATWRMADELAFDDEGRDIAVVGVVASLPVRLERGVRFELDVERVVMRRLCTCRHVFCSAGTAAMLVATMPCSQVSDGRLPCD